MQLVHEVPTSICSRVLLLLGEEALEGQLFAQEGLCSCPQHFILSLQPDHLYTVCVFRWIQRGGYIRDMGMQWIVSTQHSKGVKTERQVRVEIWSYVQLASSRTSASSSESVPS